LLSPRLRELSTCSRELRARGDVFAAAPRHRVALMLYSPARRIRASTRRCLWSAVWLAAIGW